MMARIKEALRVWIQCEWKRTNKKRKRKWKVKPTTYFVSRVGEPVYFSAFLNSHKSDELQGNMNGLYTINSQIKTNIQIIAKGRV